MEYREHDTVAKVVVSILAPDRELIPEAELRIPAYGDILMRPGPALPEVAGVLGTLVGSHLALLEYFHARPKLHELLRVRAKGFIAAGLELQAAATRNETGFANLENGRIIIIGNGFPKRALTRAWHLAAWRTPGPGVWTVGGWPHVHYFDLLRLPVRMDTAWLHVSGRSAWIQDAIKLLVESSDVLNHALLARLAQEMPHMQFETTPEQHRRGEEAANRRFLSAWQEAMVYKEGLSRGRNEGLNQGLNQGHNEALHRMLRLILTQRFGSAAEPVLAKLEPITDPATLEAIAKQGLTAVSLDELLRAPELSTE